MGIQLAFKDDCEEEYPEGYAEVSGFNLAAMDGGGWRAFFVIRIWNNKDDYAKGIRPKFEESMSVDLELELEAATVETAIYDALKVLPDEEESMLPVRMRENKLRSQVDFANAAVITRPTKIVAGGGAGGAVQGQG